MWNKDKLCSPIHGFSSSMEAELLLCPLDVPSTRWQTKHPPGGMAVAAAWLPVCAEDLTRRELLIPFWTNFRISKAIAANIIIDTENTKGFEPIWVFIFTSRISRYCRAKGWYSLSSWIHLQHLQFLRHSFILSIFNNTGIHNTGLHQLFRAWSGSNL